MTPSLLSSRGVFSLCYCEAYSPFVIASPRLNRGEAISVRGFPPVVARHDSAEAISGKIGVVSKQYYVYIMTNKKDNVIYVGVTNDLIRRVYEHTRKSWLTDSPESTT
jgi:hypothetical protein